MAFVNYIPAIAGLYFSNNQIVKSSVLLNEVVSLGFNVLESEIPLFINLIISAISFYSVANETWHLDNFYHCLLNLNLLILIIIYFIIKSFAFKHENANHLIVPVSSLVLSLAFSTHTGNMINLVYLGLNISFNMLKNIDHRFIKTSPSDLSIVVYFFIVPFVNSCRIGFSHMSIAITFMTALYGCRKRLGLSFSVYITLLALFITTIPFYNAQVFSSTEVLLFSASTLNIILVFLYFNRFRQKSAIFIPIAFSLFLFSLSLYLKLIVASFWNTGFLTTCISFINPVLFTAHIGIVYLNFVKTLTYSVLFGLFITLLNIVDYSAYYLGILTNENVTITTLAQLFLIAFHIHNDLKGHVLFGRKSERSPFNAFQVLLIFFPTLTKFQILLLDWKFTDGDQRQFGSWNNFIGLLLFNYATLIGLPLLKVVMRLISRLSDDKSLQSERLAMTRVICALLLHLSLVYVALGLLFPTILKPILYHYFNMRIDPLQFFNLGILISILSISPGVFTDGFTLISTGWDASKNDQLFLLSIWSSCVSITINFIIFSTHLGISSSLSFFAAITLPICSLLQYFLVKLVAGRFKSLLEVGQFRIIPQLTSTISNFNLPIYYLMVSNLITVLLLVLISIVLAIPLSHGYVVYLFEKSWIIALLFLFAHDQLQHEKKSKYAKKDDGTRRKKSADNSVVVDLSRESSLNYSDQFLYQNIVRSILLVLNICLDLVFQFKSIDSTVEVTTFYVSLSSNLISTCIVISLAGDLFLENQPQSAPFKGSIFSIPFIKDCLIKLSVLQSVLIVYMTTFNLELTILFLMITTVFVIVFSETHRGPAILAVSSLSLFTILTNDQWLMERFWLFYSRPLPTSFTASKVYASEVVGQFSLISFIELAIATFSIFPVHILMFLHYSNVTSYQIAAMTGINVVTVAEILSFSQNVSILSQVFCILLFWLAKTFASLFYAIYSFLLISHFLITYEITAQF